MAMRSFMLRDFVVVRLKGVWLQAERQLAKSLDDIEIVRGARRNLMSQGREKLCSQVSEIPVGGVSGLFTEIDAKIGARVMVFSLDQDIRRIMIVILNKDMLAHVFYFPIKFYA
ncbi:MAG: hypothetical protein NPIRA04_28610 [Nitrospirales bacterium]|nr:MAG: hypothetical protein NPIRA04_28610 [Nitrospirales bacterium]